MNRRYQQSYKHEDVKIKRLDRTIIKRLISYLSPYWFWVVAAVVALLLSRGIEAWIPIQVGHLSQFILDKANVSLTAVQQEAFNQVLHISMFILGLIFLSYLFDVLNILIKNWVGQKAIFDLRIQVYQHIQNLPMMFYDRHAIGRLMTRTIHDVDQINQMFAESVVPIIGSIFLFIGIVTGIFILNWRIGLVIICLLPILVWFTNRFRYYQKQGYNAIRSIVSSMNAFIQEHLMGVMIVRHFNLFDKEQKVFEEINEDYFEANIDTVHHFSVFFAGIEFMQSLAMISVFVVLFVFAPPSGFQAGTYFAISLYSLMIFRPLADLAERYNVLQSAMAAAERIFEILDTPLEPSGPQPGQPLTHFETIVFDDVWFAYEDENWILKGLSFKIEQGETVALIGMTGSGKTSIISLLLRLYDFQKGHIYVNGKDIRDYSVSSLRQLFSVILQDPVIFSGTIRENITLYDSQISPEEVKSSTDYVQLTPRIEALSDGFERILTERGMGLSVERCNC